jgi:MYND finger
MCNWMQTRRRRVAQTPAGVIRTIRICEVPTRKMDALLARVPAAPRAGLDWVTRDICTRRFCRSCGKTEPEATLKACACRRVFYCATDCQRRDWRNHKKNCAKKFPEDIVLPGGTLEFALPVSLPKWKCNSKGNPLTYRPGEPKGSSLERPFVAPTSPPWRHDPVWDQHLAGLGHGGHAMMALAGGDQHRITSCYKLATRNFKLASLQGEDLTLSEFRSLVNASGWELAAEEEESLSEDEVKSVLEWQEWWMDVGGQYTQIRDVREFPCPCETLYALCDACGKLCQSTCAACEEAYCSKECFDADWSLHKRTCKTVIDNGVIACSFNQQCWMMRLPNRVPGFAPDDLEGVEK